MRAHRVGPWVVCVAWHGVAYLGDEQLTGAPLQVRRGLGLIQSIVLEPLENCLFLGVCDLGDRNLTFGMKITLVCKKKSLFWLKITALEKNQLLLQTHSNRGSRKSCRL